MTTNLKPVQDLKIKDIAKKDILDHFVKPVITMELSGEINMRRLVLTQTKNVITAVI